jgi:hypothetical protein
MRGEETTLDDLSERQLEGVVALLQNVTVAGASRESGIPESTLYRWLAQPAFKAEYRRQRRMLFERTVGLAQRASTTAMSEVIDIMRSGESEYARLAAARIILELARETDVEQRVTEIEELLDSVDSPTGVRQLRSVSNG